jgi:hypothetical protein
MEFMILQSSEPTLVKVGVEEMFSPIKIKIKYM